MPVRIQRKRTKGWKMPENTVFVGRPSKWGNPYKIAPAFNECGIRIPEITRESAVHLYRDYIERSFAQYQSTRDVVAELRGKNLACWCPLDQPCHADVLLELANRE